MLHTSLKFLYFGFTSVININIYLFFFPLPSYFNPNEFKIFYEVYETFVILSQRFYAAFFVESYIEGYI